MLKSLTRLFDRLDGTAPAAPPAADELAAAVATLLVEQARMDTSIDAEERERIENLIAWRFGLAPTDAHDLVEEAVRRAERSTQLFGLTSAIARAYDHDARVQVVEMLWDVALADGHVHAMEASLVRRIAGLLYVDDRDSGKARKRAAARYGTAAADPSAGGS